MLTCPNCHAQLEEDSLFCDSCGAKIEKSNFPVKYCPNCGKPSDPLNEFCVNCGKPFPQEKEDFSEKSRSKKRLLLGGISAAVVAAAALFAFFLFSGNGTKTPETGYALYLKDDELFYSDLSKDSWQLTSRLIDDINDPFGDAVEIYNRHFDNNAEYFTEETATDSHFINTYYFASFMDSYPLMNNSSLINSNSPASPFQMSENGNILFFPDKCSYIYDYENFDVDYRHTFSLYYKNIHKSDKDAVKIASDVTSYQVNQNASIVTYFKGNDNSLYQYDMKSDTANQISNNVSYYLASNDGKKILYVTPDFNAYLTSLENDKEKITDDISNLNAVEDLSIIYYIKDGTLYRKDEGKDAIKISSDIDIMLNVYDSGEIYYLRQNEQEISLMDYVENDIAVADAAKRFPKHISSSAGSIATVPQIPALEVSLTSFSWWNPVHQERKDMIQSALEEAEDFLWGPEFEGPEFEGPAEEAAPAETYEENAYENYNRIIPSYEELMKDLNKNTISLRDYTLYYYDGKEETTISEHVIALPWNYSSDFPTIAFSSYDPDDIKKVKLSELIGHDFRDLTELYTYVSDYGYDLSELNILFPAIRSNLEKILSKTADEYISIYDNISEIDRDSSNTTPFFFSKDGKTIFYVDNVNEDKMKGDLYEITVSKNELGTPKLYDDDVYITSMQFITDDKFLYFKDYKNNAGDLYINKNRIGSDVADSLLCYDKTADHLYYISDLNENKSTFTLNIFKDDSPERIADDIYSFAPLSQKGLLYISDYSQKYQYGDLYLYKSKKGKSELIDNTVTDIVYYYDVRQTLLNPYNSIVYVY